MSRISRGASSLEVSRKSVRGQFGAALGSACVGPVRSLWWTGLHGPGSGSGGCGGAPTGQGSRRQQKRVADCAAPPIGSLVRSLHYGW